MNSSYRWLIVNDNVDNMLRQLELRFDSSITVGVPSDGTFTLFDVDPANNLHQVGRFHDGELLNWVDAENAPFRSGINRPVKVGVVVSRAEQLIKG